MDLDMYYYDIITRLFALVTLSLIFSGFYLKYISQPDNNSFFKQEKVVYSIQAGFWILFLSNTLATILPNNVIGFFAFELLILSITLISFTFLLWKFFNKKAFDFGIFFCSLPLILLFILALGMD